MIEATQFMIPKLKQFYGQKYLKRSKLFIRWNREMEFVIYKLDAQLKYIEYKISLRSHNLCLIHVEFIESNESNFLLGIGFKLSEFVIFVLDVKRESLLSIKRINIINFQKFNYPLNRFHTQVYILQNTTFNVIDFSKFPEMQESTFAQNVESSFILYFQRSVLLQLKQTLLPDKFYLLPLSKSSQPVKYNENLRHSLFLKDRLYNPINWNYIITKITQIYLYNNQKITKGHYFPTGHHHLKYLFNENFGIQYDGQYWIKIFQIRLRRKILRRVKNVYQLLSLESQRILCLRYDDSTIVYDFSTGQEFLFDVPHAFEFINHENHYSFLIEQDLQRLKLSYAIEQSNNMYQ